MADERIPWYSQTSKNTVSDTDTLSASRIPPLSSCKSTELFFLEHIEVSLVLLLEIVGIVTIFGLVNGVIKGEILLFTRLLLLFVEAISL